MLGNSESIYTATVLIGIANERDVVLPGQNRFHCM
jgi:hypothetical protein